ncbi:uncharacterized protein L201_003539 [Kwoniella dendrophila CBS 6074]|uniref:Uncharacterized protein n=1 Tax=Kwoniella dendrophila CBS 6074 TaxID=1295534 RepID=A0AAX4JTW9_9TREE
MLLSVELDWALGVLRKFETSHYLLQEWKPVEHLDLRDITPLFKSHDGNEEFEDISDTFIHAAHHLIKLSELGYSKECLSLVEVSGFDLDILLHCYVPGLGLPLPKSNEAPSQELQKQTLSSEANLRHLKPSP